MRPLDRLMARALSGDADYVRTALRDNPGLLAERDILGSGASHAALHGGHSELPEPPQRPHAHVVPGGSPAAAPA